MSALTVAILSTSESRHRLVTEVEATGICRITLDLNKFPVSAADPALDELSNASPSVVIFDLPDGDDAEQAMRSIDLATSFLRQSVIFAVGTVSNPRLIINAMRAGAREFLERPANVVHLREAIVRHCGAPQANGKVFTFVNAKGGNGATTMAVNTAVAARGMFDNVAIVDMAVPGYVSLHLNANPKMRIIDMLHDVDRIDATVLDTLTTASQYGVALIASSDMYLQPEAADEMLRLIEVLRMHNDCVIIDASSNIGIVSRAACSASDEVLLAMQPDLSSIWGARKTREVLESTVGKNKISLVMNRYRRIPGLNDSDIEQSAGARIAYRIPNRYDALTRAIETGVPVATDPNSEAAQPYVQLAASLTGKAFGKAAAQKVYGRSLLGSMAAINPLSLTR